MSWSFDYLAEGADAAAQKISGEAHMPDATKAAICDALATVALPPDHVLRVKSSGHIGSYGGNVSFEIGYSALVRAAPAAALPADPPAPEAAPV